MIFLPGSSVGCMAGVKDVPTISLRRHFFAHEIQARNSTLAGANDRPEQPLLYCVATGCATFGTISTSPHHQHG